jgi:hypothetical protein
MRRLSTVVAGLMVVALPMSISAIAFSGTASAQTPVTCSKISYNASSGNVVITGKKCKAKPPKATPAYGNASGSASVLAGGGNVTWANTDYFTIGTPTTTAGNPKKCAKTASAIDASGPVTASSSDAYDAQLVGTTFTADVCLESNGGIKLQKGSKVIL